MVEQGSGDGMADAPDRPAAQQENGSGPGTAVANQVGLTYLAPPADLADLFGPFYSFVANKTEISDHTRADFAQLRFMLAGTGDYLFSTGSRRPTPAVCLLGPTMGATRFEVAGPMRVLGVSVLPLGWAALGVGDASDRADDLLDMATFGRGWEELRAGLSLLEVEAAADAVWAFLRPRLRHLNRADYDFVVAADRWLADELSPRIDVLQEATGLSARQVGRLCNRYYGAPPKYLARKYRALRCALMLARDNVDWTDVSEGVFYDQSHFIREFKHFIGLTPSQLRDEASLVIRLTMNRRDVAGEIARLSRIS